jgi:hypothetical protein
MLHILSHQCYDASTFLQQETQMKLLNPFRTPSPEELIARELDQARRGLLEAQTARDYASAMVIYHETRIDRLRTQLETMTREEQVQQRLDGDDWK